MTRPPQGPDEHEPTRRLDPLDGAGAYDQSQTHAYSEPDRPYEQPAATQYQQPPTQGHYYDQPYTQGQSYTGGQPPAEPPRKTNTGRTVGLSLAIVLALIVIGFVGYRIASGGDSPNTAAVPSESTVTTDTPSETTESSTTESTTESTSETPTSTDPIPVGQVTYQITGDGDVVGLTYRTSGGNQFVATAGSPWQQTAKVSQGRAELNAIVIRGKLSCTISRGDEVLSSSTSAGGTLRCSATLPASE
ncbi:hypothetical protein [Gordonia sp. CPCC 205333]|uniref:hypothetical protein n=1 Tax=Gordonia sp. CPCC 205333 TaxID=3140790 RepID=UPI003AF3A59E